MMEKEGLQGHIRALALLLVSFSILKQQQQQQQQQKSKKPTQLSLSPFLEAAAECSTFN